jgi:ABC-type lipoprotein export system ATPase subunit
VGHVAAVGDDRIPVEGERLGQTILMITHNPEAAAYGHYIVHMRDGRIIQRA